MAARINKLNLIIGNRGTGKTSFIKGDPEHGITGLLSAYTRHKTIKKSLIVDHYDNPVWRHVDQITIEKLERWKSGTCRLFGSDLDKINYEISRKCYNTVIIYEDATPFIKRNLPKELEIALIDSKQRNCDYYFLYHYMWAPPSDLIRIADTLTLFKTGDAMDNSLWAKYSKNPAVKTLFDHVNNNPDFHYKATIKLR